MVDSDLYQRFMARTCPECKGTGVCQEGTLSSAALCQCVRMLLMALVNDQCSGCAKLGARVETLEAARIEQLQAERERVTEQLESARELVTRLTRWLETLKSLDPRVQAWRNDPTRCHSDSDGDCSWANCPQLRDGEPKRSGRGCPLYRSPEEF